MLVLILGCDYIVAAFITTFRGLSPNICEGTCIIGHNNNNLYYGMQHLIQFTMSWIKKIMQTLIGGVARLLRL